MRLLRANLGLHRATGERRFLDEARRLNTACDWFVDEKTEAYRDNVNWSHLQVEADLQSAKGAYFAHFSVKKGQNGVMIVEHDFIKP